MNVDLRAEATRLGIPLKVAITDDIRHRDCDAREAGLASIEGKHAIYKGHCANGHHYTIKRLIAEQSQTKTKRLYVSNGKLAFGEQSEYKATDLQEY